LARDTALYALDVRADSATLGDVRFLDTRFPAATVLRGRVAVRSHGGRVLEVRLDPLELRDGAGTLSAKSPRSAPADSGIVALRQADLTTQDFSLEFARPFLDTLPFAGHLSATPSPMVSCRTCSCKSTGRSATRWWRTGPASW